MHVPDEQESLREKASKALKSAREAKSGFKAAPGAEIPGALTDYSLNFSLDPEAEEWLEQANTATRKALNPEQKPPESR
jgi:hypothetical protein